MHSEDLVHFDAVMSLVPHTSAANTNVEFNT